LEKSLETFETSRLSSVLTAQLNACGKGPLWSAARMSWLLGIPEVENPPALRPGLHHEGLREEGHLGLVGGAGGREAGEQRRVRHLERLELRVGVRGQPVEHEGVHVTGGPVLGERLDGDAPRGAEEKSTVALALPLPEERQKTLLRSSVKSK
jgi:hypothetical protein